MTYTRRYFRFFSEILRHDLEVLHFGNWGYPLILFPQENGRFYDMENNGIIASLYHHLEEGYLQVFCLDSLDQEIFAGTGTLLDKKNHWLNLEKHWCEEFIPYAKKLAENNFLAVAGCDLGATYAINLTLRHPDLIRRCIALSGYYDLVNCQLFNDFSLADIKNYLSDINPIDYATHLAGDRWQEMGGDRTEIKLLTANYDHCLDDSLRLSEIFTENGIHHHMEIWEGEHDWYLWGNQIATFA